MSGSRWTWRLLALPGVAWLSVFFLVALYAVLAVAFGNQDTLSQPVPFWNPLDWNVGYVLEMLKNIWHGCWRSGSRCSSAIRWRTTRPATPAAGRASSSSR
jgi:hypothetical protein